jgi:glycolate oxidase
VGQAHAAVILKAFESSGATWAAVSTDEQESEALFDARRLAYLALERLGPIITEDVCVPVGAVSEMLGRIEAISRRRQTFIAIIAHVGDGNLHPLLIAKPGDIEATNRALSAFDDILSAAIELGGTITGEHGVGLLKRDGLAKELAGEVIDMHRAVKRALDPHGIFNMRKIFSVHSQDEGGT